MWENIAQFLKSPQGRALAAGLLSNSGYSPRPITLGEAMGQGLLGMQQAGQQEFENQYKSSLLDLKKNESQAYLNNMRQQQAMAMRKLQMMEDQQQAMSRIKDLIGEPGKPTQEPLMPQPGRGLLGGEITPEQFRQQAARHLLGIGDYQTAFNMLEPQQQGGAGSFGQPREVIGPDGKPMLVQFDKEGNMRPVEGYQPLIKGTNIEYDPSSGSFSVTQGAPQNLTAGMKTHIMKEIEQLEKMHERLYNVASQFDDDSYLRTSGKLKGKYNEYVLKHAPESLQDFLFKVTGQKPKEALAYTGKLKAFTHEVEQLTNEYIKFFSGRPGPQIYKLIRPTILNMDLDPKAFRTVMKKLNSNWVRTRKRLQGYLDKGFQLTDDQIADFVRDGLDEGVGELAERIGYNLSDNPGIDDITSGSTNNYDADRIYQVIANHLDDITSGSTNNDDPLGLR